MSFVLGVVVIDPIIFSISEDFAPLVIQEAQQDAEARKHACNLEGLARYFDDPIRGKCFYVSVDTGQRFPSSKVFFPWPEDAKEDSKPILLRIGPAYRAAFNALLTQLLRASQQGKIIIVSEWNGDVTSVRTRQEAQEDLAVGEVQWYGPYNLETFWQVHDLGHIEYPSITLVEDTSTNAR